MTTKHTLGPWMISRDYPKQIGIHGTANQYGSGLVTLVPRDDCDVDEAEANARLIAAAPDLLQILETIVEDVGYGGGGAKLCEQFLNRAKSAIARARG